MVATLSALHKRSAVETTLPALRLGLINEFGNFGVLRAVLRLVHLVVAKHADFNLAARTVRVLPTLAVLVDVRRFDPVAARGCWTVYTISSVVFFVLSVPEHLELDVELLVHVFQWDVVFCAAARRHLGGIFHGHCEDALQAVVTHTVSAGQFRSMSVGHVVRSACQAFY